MRNILLIVVLVAFTLSCESEETGSGNPTDTGSGGGRFIEFTDANGERHKYELAEDSGSNDAIITHRPDGSREARIFYEDGELVGATAYQPDRSPDRSIGSVCFFDNDCATAGFVRAMYAYNHHQPQAVGGVTESVTVWQVKRTLFVSEWQLYGHYLSVARVG